jgi:hypothetical protein
MPPEYTHIRAALSGPVIDLVLATWQTLAAEHRATGFYASALNFERVYPLGGDPLAAAIRNHAPYAQVLETGHSGFHLPSVIDWGAAVGRGTAKVSAKGTRYLHIPLRHRTPASEAGGITSERARTAMPRQVYRDALKAIRGDERARARLETAGPWLSRPYRAYSFPSPRRGPGPAALAERAERQEGHPGYTWRSPLYSGLVRRDVSAASGGSRGEWSTLRTLSEDSVGWYVPPMAGFHFAERTVREVAPMVRELLGTAAREDLVQLVQTSFERPH